MYVWAKSREFYLRHTISDIHKWKLKIKKLKIKHKKKTRLCCLYFFLASVPSSLRLSLSLFHSLYKYLTCLCFSSLSITTTPSPPTWLIVAVSRIRRETRKQIYIYIFIQHLQQYKCQKQEENAFYTKLITLPFPSFLVSSLLESKKNRKRRQRDKETKRETIIKIYIYNKKIITGNAFMVKGED